MKILSLLSMLLILIVIDCSCQKHDYNWLTGYRGNDHVLTPGFGVTRINFNTPSLNPEFIFDTFRKIDFGRTSSNISSASGDYLFSFNGYHIEKDDSSIMWKADKGITNSQGPFTDIYQSSLIIPYYSTGKFIMIHEDQWFNYPGVSGVSSRLDYSVIDLNSNGNRGSIVTKKVNLIQDTLDNGRVLAIKHANGRDWWIIKSRFTLNEFYKILVTPKGIEIRDRQKIGVKQINPLGGVSVSPKGDKIIYYMIEQGGLATNPDTGFYIHIYNFDRCSGELINPKIIKIDSDVYPHFGGAFSPNGKYFYLSRPFHILQIDMEESHLALDTVASYDGFTQLTPSGTRNPTWFGVIERAPDGRIYGTTNCCGQQYLFRINKPDQMGMACDVQQHFKKITMHLSLPSFPNYRLGPEDGTSCDTLGIDNIPIAEYRYDLDSLHRLTRTFTDLSYYEPESWIWDFGDPDSGSSNSSTERFPEHEFSKEGRFNVCLEVSNIHGSDKICKEITIDQLVSSKDPHTVDPIIIYPNPFQDEIVICCQSSIPLQSQMMIYNHLGECVVSKSLLHGSYRVRTTSLDRGVYHVVILDGNKIVTSQSIVKL